MKIIVSDRADFQLKSTALYIQAEFGGKFRARFVNEFRHVLSLLRKHPRLGSVEPLLEGLPQEYRSIVFGHVNKLVYPIQQDTISVVDLWDTRRDPEALSTGVKKEP